VRNIRTRQVAIGNRALVSPGEIAHCGSVCVADVGKLQRPGGSHLPTNITLTIDNDIRGKRKPRAVCVLVCSEAGRLQVTVEPFTTDHRPCRLTTSNTQVRAIALQRSCSIERHKRLVAEAGDHVEL